jgi:site-specific DNA-cytosine methylase
MTHLDLFSGIGCFSLAAESAGWRTVAFSEIEPFPCAVLAHRWPDVPNLGDVCASERCRFGSKIRDNRLGYRRCPLSAGELRGWRAA